MQKEAVVQKLKEQGCRITKQRLILLDIILEDEHSSYKEIYYKANAIDDRIGMATVYRMVNILEEIGAISRRNMYQITRDEEAQELCTVEFDDNTSCRLTEKQWHAVVLAGLADCGYIQGKHIRNIAVRDCNFAN